MTSDRALPSMSLWLLYRPWRSSMRSIWLASLLGLAAGAAQAADNGFYLGAGITQSQIDGFQSQDFDLEDTAWKVIAGFRPLDVFAVEASYMDLGDDETTIPGLGTAQA